jgi:uncharacterized protein
VIVLEPHDDGVILPVRAQPGSRNSELRGELNGVLKVAVTQVAEKGKANQAIIALLSKQLGLRKSQIELLSGTTSAQKKFLVRGPNIDQLREVIEIAIRNRRER